MVNVRKGMIEMDNKSLKNQLLLLEKQLLTPETRTSIEELNELLADEFFEFSSSGRVWFKKDCIDDGGLTVYNMSLYDFEIHPLAPNVVLATYRVKDETRNQHTLRSSIWKNNNGKWQMCFHQGTKTNGDSL